MKTSVEAEEKTKRLAPRWKRRPDGRDGRVSSDVIGIDQGSGLVWKNFMRAPEVRRALQRAGFRATLSPGEWRRRGSEEPGRYFFAARAASIIWQDVLMISRRAWRRCVRRPGVVDGDCDFPRLGSQGP